MTRRDHRTPHEHIKYSQGGSGLLFALKAQVLEVLFAAAGVCTSALSSVRGAIKSMCWCGGGGNHGVREKG